MENYSILWLLQVILMTVNLLKKSFVEFVYGKPVGDKGYISKNLFERLFVDWIQLITKLKSNMKGALMSVSDKLLHGKRAVIETINEELKNIAQTEHSRHWTFDNFIVNLIGCISCILLLSKETVYQCFTNDWHTVYFVLNSSN